MSHAATADRVVIVASDGWLKCFLREEKSGEGKGSATEAWVIFNRLKEAYFMSADIRLAVFGEVLPKRFSLFFPDYTHFKLPREWANLIHWLSNSRESTPASTTALPEPSESQQKLGFSNGNDRFDEAEKGSRPIINPDSSPTKVERIVPENVIATPGPLPTAGITLHWRIVPAGLYYRGFTRQAIASILIQLNKERIDVDSVGEMLRAEPSRQVNVPEFQIARELVTNSQFRYFIDATGYRTTAERNGAPVSWQNYATPDKASHPVVHVSFEDAQAFCRWAGVRLPTLDEWLKAYRGPIGNIYPWGDQYDPMKCNTAENTAISNTSPVDMFAAYTSYYGCYDMVGNVHEWVDARGDSLQHVQNANPAVIEHLRQTRAVMGGAWDVPCQIFGLPVMNMLAPVDKSDDDLGFRVAK
jgi:formylglycine-generating enzyme required for sulfatase activity